MLPSWDCVLAELADNGARGKESLTCSNTAGVEQGSCRESRNQHEMMARTSYPCYQANRSKQSGIENSCTLAAKLLSLALESTYATTGSYPQTHVELQQNPYPTSSDPRDPRRLAHVNACMHDIHPYCSSMCLYSPFITSHLSSKIHQPQCQI